MAHPRNAPHSAVENIETGFYGCVNLDSCNPSAHGGIQEQQQCDCGATRFVNINGPFVELGRWHMATIKNTYEIQSLVIQLIDQSAITAESASDAHDEFNSADLYVAGDGPYNADLYAAEQLITDAAHFIESMKNETAYTAKLINDLARALGFET